MESTTELQSQRRKPKGAIGELGLRIEREGEELVGRADIVDGMLLPGTDTLRLSVVAAWADTLLGLIAMPSVAPKVPTTVELDVHVSAPIRNCETVLLRGRCAKLGRTISFFTLDISDEQGRPLGHGHSQFMATPNPKYSLPSGDWALEGFAQQQGTLTEPVARRVQCERREQGVASLPWAPDIQNATKAINGGILALAIEEAILSAAEPGQSLSSMLINYLRSVRTGPALARAQVMDCLGRVEVYDEANGSLAALATAQLFSVG